jgi:hypothetical protein
MAALVPESTRHPLPVQGGDRPKGLNALGTLAQYPVLTHAFNAFNGHILFGTTLSLRHRELIVLRVAALRELRGRVEATCGSGCRRRHDSCRSRMRRPRL